MAAHRRRWWAIGLGVPIVVIAIAVLLFRWDWLIPFVDARASAALHREVRIGHLHVALGRRTVVTAEDVRVADPAGFPADDAFATARRLAITVDLWGFLHDRSVLRIPVIDVDAPRVTVATDKDGTPNYDLSLGGGSGGGPAVRIGALRIEDGQAHVDIPKLRARFDVAVATEDEAASGTARADAAGGAAAAQGGRIRAEAHGTYAGQPITARFVGGALLGLRDAHTPYPVDLHVENGPTRVSLTGTVDDPLHFRGTALKLSFAGPDMALLKPLTGVPIPRTPPFAVTGDLTYADGRITFRHAAGTLGRSDIEGDVAITPPAGGQRQKVVATLASRRVDMQDLGGFIGSTPGDTGERGQTPAQRRQVAAAEASTKLLPDTPINIPRLRAADVHLEYKAASIEGSAKLTGRGNPLDNLSVVLDLDDGAIRVHPIVAGIGTGRIVGDIALTPVSDTSTRLHADVNFDRVSIARLMQSAGFSGAGVIGGRAEIDSAGRSLAQFAANGNGGVRLATSGGELSALLVALSGLQFGNALVSALGLPEHARLRCMVADMPLRRGVLDSRLLLIDTDESNIRATGTVDLRDERIDLRLETNAKHFSIGSLPTPIDIGGTLKAPTVAPAIGPLAARGGAAVALGVLLTPLAALLPTVQLGTAENHDCRALIARTEAPARAPQTRRRATAR